MLKFKNFIKAAVDYFKQYPHKAVICIIIAILFLWNICLEIRLADLDDKVSSFENDVSDIETRVGSVESRTDDIEYRTDDIESRTDDLEFESRY